MAKEKKKHWASKKEKKQSMIGMRIKNFIRPTIIYNIVLTIFIGVVVYSFVLSDFLEINEVSVVSGESILAPDIKKAVDEKMEGKYFKIVSRKNFIFFNSQKIETGLKDEFKKIKTVSVSKEFPNKVKVEIQERKLILTLCSRGECYFIDENGYAYEKINPQVEVENKDEIIELIDESGKEIKENEYVLLPRYVEFLVSVAAEIKNKASIEITNEYRTRSRISEEVIVQTKKGWDIYLNTKFPIDKSVQTLKTLLNRHLMLRDLNELEYIDLRSENKVFYRMIGGVTQEEEEIKKESEAADNPEGSDTQTVKEEEKKEDEKKEEDNE